MPEISHHMQSSLTPRNLVIFLNAQGASSISDSWVEALQAIGVRLFCHARLKGVEQTRSGIAEFGALCAEIHSAAPDHDLILLRHPLLPDDFFLHELSRLLAAQDKPAVLTTLSNAHPDLNPFAGLMMSDVPGPGAAEQRMQWVNLLSPAQLYPQDTLHSDVLALPGTTVAQLSDPSLGWQAVPGRLRDLGTGIELADWLYLEDPGIDPCFAPPLEPHEAPQPAPWAALTERLQSRLISLPAAGNHASWHDDYDAVAKALRSTEPASVTLHITHSWGGGVATWVKSFIEAKGAGEQLQLRSEGPQSGQGAGQRLSLYAGNDLSTAIDRWWIFPAIGSIETQHAHYRAVLESVCERFGVGRIIVSSLVGHSLDALRCGLPTLQILHDHFPLWPLLSIHPQEYNNRLEQALTDPRAREPFGALSLEDCRRISKAYVEAAANVSQAAPSASALTIQKQLDPTMEGRKVPVIPHGLPPLELIRVAARQRPDGRLRLLVPGRVQTGKGADLLEAALDGLSTLAQVTLLGSGKGGERFFGRSGVNVILEYQRDELPGLLQTLAPDAALLLSTVPETFSYTLSEMNALGIPVVATRLGSFVERIKADKTGWLIEPSAEALLAQIAELHERPETLNAVREHLQSLTPRSIDTMREDYDRLLAPQMRTALRPARPPALVLAQGRAAAHADQSRRLGQQLNTAHKDALKLQALVQERTQWADSLKGDIKKLHQQLAVRTAQIEDAEQELASRAEHIAAQGRELDERAEHIDKLDLTIADAQGRISGLQSTLKDLQETHRQVINSHSWKITRPLRVGRRLLARLVQLRAWNPLRWPLLLSQLLRNLTTVGWSGTLRRAQQPETVSAPSSQDDPQVLLPLQAQTLPAEVPDSDAPVISVIIPAYNHLDHTAACLLSIAETRNDVAFEVILVDDASSDATEASVSAVAGLHYLRNAENLGFIGSCNRGAGAARGEYLVMLNNDTQVHDHWLDLLLKTFETQPQAGLVGARLVYPDGTLQECGGMVFNDGSGWNIGRGDDPDRPEYQSLREVDYCSGACIMLRSALFKEFGGFDPHYAPAYYEDTDLAFKVRQAGLKVLVQPAVSIVHFEGVSSGTDLQSGTKRFQVVNQKKFKARWAAALEQQPAPIKNPQDATEIRAARDHRLRGRVLLVDAYTPEPDQDSGSVRLVNLMECLLELGFAVTFFADNRAWSGKYTQNLQAMGVEVWYDPWLRSAQEFFQDRGTGFDHVIISRHYIATNYTAMLKRYAPQANFIFDTVDLHYLREQRQAELEDSAVLQQTARQTRRAELAVIKQAAATLVVSPTEQALLAKDAPAAPVYLLSNIHEVAEHRPGFSERKDIYFVGGYQHPPNIDAACWFVEEIWPLIHAASPQMRFHLMGSKAPEKVRNLQADGVVFHGFVESLEPFLNECRISVAPLRYGAGVKGKVNQAMAHGQPVVATPTAVEGINAQHEAEVLVADDAAGFAAAVLRLYEDQALWETLSAGAVENVQKHFSKDAAKADLETLFAGLKSTR